MKPTSIALWATLLIPACAEGDATSLLQKPMRQSQRLHTQKGGVHLLETAHTIISKVNAGNDPNGCSAASDAARTALEEALPAIHEQLTHLSNQVQIAAQVVENCASERGDLAQQGIDLQELRANHQTCRLTENGLEDAVEVCQQYTELRNSLQNRCFSFPNDESGFPEAVQQGRDALDVAFNQAVLLREQCNAAREALASQHTECDSAQHQFENLYCVSRSDCAGVQACRVDTEASFGQMVEETQAALETLRGEYQVLKHVECLLGHADQALEQSTIVSGDTVSACSTDLASTDELTIDFPVFDAFSECPQPQSGDPQCPGFETQWQLVIKSNGDELLGFNSEYWTNSVLLNEQSPVAEAGNAKYAAFNDAPVTQIRLCMDSPEDNCFEHTLPSPQTSAHSLFSAGYIEDRTFDKEDLLSVLGESPQRDCPMDLPGFNTECPQNNRARFGFCNNVPDQPCSGRNAFPRDEDAALGIGLKGQESRAVGAGWTHFGINRQRGAVGKNMWLWVK